MNKAIDFLKRNLTKESTIVVACSGGPDSMCLLSLLNDLKREFNLKIICAHVNHKVRKASDSEAKMVEKYANNNKDIFELLEIKEYINGDFSEEDARKRRYKFFDELIKKYHAKFLLTAHHGDDLVETILMRLTRGSNLSGYIGIRSVSSNDEYTILRPLLTVTKEEILKYNEEKKIEYAVDNSNENIEYTRNRYRKTVLPFLKKENQSVHEKYLKFSEELTSYEEFVNEYIAKLNAIVDNSIITNNLKDESLFIKRKCLEIIIKNIQSKDILEVNDNQTKEILKLFSLENKSIDLNNGYKAVNSYGKLQIIKIAEDIWDEVIIDKDIEVGNFKFYYNKTDGDTTNACIYLNSKEISMPLKLRTWQEGDKISVKNLQGRKKVGDIFIDNKIPKQERKKYPVLVDANDTILWLPNLKKSQFAKDKQEKYDIIIKCEAR